MVAQKLLTTTTQKRPAKPGPEYHSVTAAKVRYIVLCYGVPLKIVRDTTLKEEGGDKVQEQMRGRNEAAVDADLALLPSSHEPLPLIGPLHNPFYLATNAAMLDP